MAVWEKTSGSKIPDNAIRAGYEKDGKPLFIARAKMGGLWTSGKCGTHLPGAHIPNDCKEVIVRDYDVLVYPINAVGLLDWKQASGGKVPDKAFKTDTDLYVGRANYTGSLIPCRISTSQKCAYMGYGGKEYNAKEYEVLCQIK
nr:natterin-4 [Crassostrea gigas]